MLKRFMAAVTVICMLFVVAGCGKTTDDVLKSTSSKGKTQINFWTHYTTMRDLQTQLINEFNAKNNDVEIVLNMVGDKYGDVLNMAMATNEAPDIFSVQGPSLTKKAADLGWAEPLDSYFTPEVKDKFREGVFIKNNNVINGKTYAIPDQMSTYRLIYNKELFERAGLHSTPKTYAEFREYAKKISNLGNGVEGFALAMGDGYYLDLTVFNGMGYRSSGTLLGFDYSTGNFHFEKYKPGLELLKNMKKDGSMLEGELLLTTDQARGKFADGKIGMIASASWEASIYNDLAPKFEVGFTDWPTIDGTPKGKNVIQIGSGYAMSAKSKNKEAAWKVLSFICSPEYTGRVNKEAGCISVFKNQEQTQNYANKFVQGFLPTENDVIWPPLVPALKMQGDTRQDVFKRIISEDTANIDSEIEDLNKRTNEAFAKAIEKGEFNKEDYYIENFDPLGL